MTHRWASASFSRRYRSASAGFFTLASSSFSLRVISCSCSMICCVRSTTWTCIFSSSMRCLVFATWQRKIHTHVLPFTVYKVRSCQQMSAFTVHCGLNSHPGFDHIWDLTQVKICFAFCVDTSAVWIVLKVERFWRKTVQHQRSPWIWAEFLPFVRDTKVGTLDFSPSQRIWSVPSESVRKLGKGFWKHVYMHNT